MKLNNLAPLLLVAATQAQAAPQIEDSATRFIEKEVSANARVAQLTGEMNADLEATLCEVAMKRYPQVIEELGEQAAAKLGQMPRYDAPEGSELATTAQKIEERCEGQVPTGEWQAYTSNLDASWGNYYATVLQAVIKKFEALNRTLDRSLIESMEGNPRAGEGTLEIAREYSVALVQMIIQTGRTPEALLQGYPYAEQIRSLGLDVTAVKSMEEALNKTHQALALLEHFQKEYAQSNSEEQQQLMDAILFLGAAQYEVEGSSRQDSQAEDMDTEAGEVQMGPAFTLTMDRPNATLPTDSTPSISRKGDGVWLAALEDSLRMAAVAGTYGYMSAYPHLTPQESWDLAVAGVEASYAIPANRHETVQCDQYPFLSQRLLSGAVYVPHKEMWKAVADETTPRYVPMSTPDQMLTAEMARFTGCTNVEQAIWLSEWKAPSPTRGKKKKGEAESPFQAYYTGPSWASLPNQDLACREWGPQTHHACQTMLDYFDANELTLTLMEGYKEGASRLDLRVQANTLNTDPETVLTTLAQAQVALDLEGAQK